MSYANLSRLGLAAVAMVAVAAGNQHAAGQFYGFGPSSGVSIQTPFFSLNSPSGYGPSYWGPGYRGPGYLSPSYRGLGFPFPHDRGPSVGVFPLPSDRYYEYQRFPSYGYGYGYGDSFGYGYLATPGISSLRIETAPGYFGLTNDSLPHRVIPADPYHYRGDVVTPRDPRLPPPVGPYSSARAQVDDALASVDPQRFSDELRIAAEQLRQSLLSRRDDGDVWLDYLNPDLIIDALLEADDLSPETFDAIGELLPRYDGVVGNPQLRSVTQTSGFARTRSLLRQWLTRHPTDPAGQDAGETSAARESLPMPSADERVPPAEPTPSHRRSF